MREGFESSPDPNDPFPYLFPPESAPHPLEITTSSRPMSLSFSLFTSTQLDSDLLASPALLFLSVPGSILIFVGQESLVLSLCVDLSEFQSTTFSKSSLFAR